MRMKLTTLLAFAGLFVVALAANAVLPSAAVVGQTAANSGGQAGQDGWGSPVAVTNNRLENVTWLTNGHKVVYGAGGVGHVVWYDQAGDAVYYKRFYPGSGWSKELQLAKTAGLSYPSIALDSDGSTIHVVWRMWKHVGTTNFHVYYWKCVVTGPGTGGWVGVATDLCSNASGNDHLDPSIACGPNHQVAVSWWERGGYPNWVSSVGFREYAGGSWQPQATIAGPMSGYMYCPSVAINASGKVFVAYYGSPWLQNRDSFHVYVSSRIGGVWQSWENVTSSVGYPDSFITPHIDVDPLTGDPHVVCHSYSIAVSGIDTSRFYHIYHTYYDGSGWTVPAMISDPGVQLSTAPSMAFTSDGAAQVIWGEGAPSFGIVYSVRNPSTGAWSTPSCVTSNSSYRHSGSSIAVAPGGVLQAIWTRYDATARYPYQIWGSSYSGSFGGPMAGKTATPLGLALDVSPNPLSREGAVNYSLPVAANVSLKLYDIGGAMVRTVTAGQAAAGSHTAALSRQGLARGAYILKLEAGGYRLTSKLVVE